jgi:hypothetical protein
MFRLRYVGDGEHYVCGYPFGEIEVDDLDEALRLAESGLYEFIEGDEPDPDPAVSGADAPSQGQE